MANNALLAALFGGASDAIGGYQNTQRYNQQTGMQKKRLALEQLSTMIQQARMQQEQANWNKMFGRQEKWRAEDIDQANRDRVATQWGKYMTGAQQAIWDKNQSARDLADKETFAQFMHDLGAPSYGGGSGSGTTNNPYGLETSTINALLGHGKSEAKYGGDFGTALNTGLNAMITSGLMPERGWLPGTGRAPYSTGAPIHASQLRPTGQSVPTSGNTDQTIKAFNDIVSDMQANGIGDIDWNAAAQYYPGANINEVRSKVEAWMNSKR